jgi:hypothetical protein
MLSLEFSRRLAYVAGVITPLAETIRRWSTWRETPANFVDDYLLGAFLIYGAWRTGRDARTGRPYLTAAWAFACGLGYYSFFGQLEGVRRGDPDPARIASGWVLAIKGVAWTIAILALIVSLKQIPASESGPLK